MNQDLLETVSDGVATLTLNRPDSLNALSEDMSNRLYEAIIRLGADASVGAIVLTGAGRAFCAGGDVKGMNSDVKPTFQQRQDGVRRMHRIPMALANCPKVTIASINGPAMGAGLGIALACDFRIVARTARFGISFVKIGLATDFGVSWTLPRVVNPAKARELMLAGDIFDAATAEQIGLATRVVDDADLVNETAAWATRFAKGPRLAQQTIKRNIQAAQMQSFQELLDLEALHQIPQLDSEDHKEGARAFVERRPAVFKGC